MKKLILACGLFLFAAACAHAQQELETPPKTEMSKEKKAELKKMKEAHLEASYKDAGLTEDEIKQAREVIQDAMQKSNELKADNALTEEERKARKDAINSDKNNKLKEIMGEKYKAWSDIRKKQKSEEEEFAKGS